MRIWLVALTSMDDQILDGLEIDVELQIDFCQPGHFGSPLWPSI